MKYLRCTLQFDEAAMHPVHRLVDEHDGIRRDRLLHANTEAGGWDTFLFHVEGDRSAYVATLEDAPQVRAYEVTPLGDGEFYAYVEQTASDAERQLHAAVSRSGVILVPPVEFGPGGAAELTLLGESAGLQAAVASLPGEVEVCVERVGEYDAPRAGFDPGLTERQWEAVAAAVEAGYYDVPRSGSVEEVAGALDCSPGTASEHLRKAEGRVFRALVDARSPG